MFVHKLVDIDQEETRQHGTCTKGDGHQIHLREGDRIQGMSSSLNGVDRFWSPVDLREYVCVPRDRAGTEDGDQLGDGGDGGETDVDGGVSDVIGGFDGELMAEDVVEDGEADHLADGTDGDG